MTTSNGVLKVSSVVPNGVSIYHKNGVVPTPSTPKPRPLRDRSLPIFKTIVKELIVVVAILACSAHFGSQWTYESSAMKDEWKKCVKSKSCPHWTIPVEIASISLDLFCLVFSVVRQLVSLKNKKYLTSIKKMDVIVYLLFGILLLAGGVMMIVSSFNIDTFMFAAYNPRETDRTNFLKFLNAKADVKRKNRFLVKHTEKLVAGSLGVSSGVLSMTIAILTQLSKG